MCTLNQKEITELGEWIDERNVDITKPIRRVKSENITIIGYTRNDGKVCLDKTEYIDGQKSVEVFELTKEK